MTEKTNSKVAEKSLSRWMKFATIFVLSLALAIIIIDTTLLNVSFSYLIKDFNTDIKSLQWVITAYSLTLAALTITGGRIGDLFGRKKMFRLGAGIFAIGSLIASLSHSVGQMIIGESIIEGIGAALMMPATASLLVSNFRGKERAMAMGIWGGIAGASSAIGPILGGYLTTNYSWRWGFRINVFVAAILILGSAIIREFHDEEEKPSLDWLGVILSSTGLLALVFGIIESSSYGWIKAKEIFEVAGHKLDLGSVSIVVPSLILATFLLVSFVLWELKVAKTEQTPLVNMKIFKNKQFSTGALTVTIMALGQSGLFFATPVYFQSVLKLDAYHTGLAMLPVSITTLIVAPLTAALTQKFSIKRTIQFGLLMSAVAMLVMRNEIAIDATTRSLIPGLVLYGIGMGSVMAPVSNLIMSSVSVQEAGEVSGLNNTVRQLGMTLGTAILGAVMLSALTQNLTDGINGSSVIPTPMKAQISQAVSSQTSNVEFGGGAKVSGNVPPQVSNEITKVSHQATTDSNKLVLIYSSIIIFLGFISAAFIPKIQNVEREESLAVGH